MAFGLTGILDSFGDTEGPPMTGWATPTGVAGLKSNGTTCLANAANALGIWNSVLSGADCEGFVTVTTAAGSGATVAVYARAKDTGSAATIDAYGVVVTEAAPDSWAIRSFTNGVGSTLGAGFTQEVSNGDKIGIRCIGSSIQAWYCASGGSWTMLAERTDTTYAAAGYLALSLSDTTARVDDFGGGVAFEGAASITLGALTSGATGALALAGSGTITLGTLTAAGAGALSIAGQAGITLGALTSSATGAVSISGQAAITLEDVTSAATGAIAILGQSYIALDALTANATGVLPIGGQLSATLESLSATSTGVLSITGQAAITLSDVATSATGTLAIAGAANITLGDATATATGALPIVGQAAIALDALTLTATGELAAGGEITGQVNVTLGDLTVLSTGSASTSTSPSGGVSFDSSLTWKLQLERLRRIREDEEIAVIL